MFLVLYRISYGDGSGGSGGGEFSLIPIWLWQDHRYTYTCMYTYILYINNNNDDNGVAVRWWQNIHFHKVILGWVHHITQIPNTIHIYAATITLIIILDHPCHFQYQQTPNILLLNQMIERKKGTTTKLVSAKRDKYNEIQAKQSLPRKTYYTYI